MAYHFDNHDRSIVWDGFDAGIGDSPFTGLADMRNVNIVSVPGEASVNFSTSTITQQPSTGSVTSADSGADTVTITNGSLFDSGAWIVFSGGSLPGGIVAGTAYKAILVSPNTYSLFTDYNGVSLLNITSTGTGTWNTINMGQPKYFAYSSGEQTYWMVDSNGYVWSNAVTTQSLSAYWTYTGNRINNYSKGNGLVYYRASDGTGYMFVFSNSSIDYTPTATASIAWTYQWVPATGATGAYSATPNQILKAGTGGTTIHEAIVGPDNKVYYTDTNWIGRWYQASPTTAFVPTTPSTYVFDQTAVLPFTDTAQCLAPLGNTMLIGGKNNILYPWDTFSNLPSFPIFIPEYNMVKLITVNTNTFIFTGNRGRIYYTNGTNAQLYKKIPDHISGTVEPYFTWGGVASNKNQLYFGVLVTTNAGSAVNEYGGMWAIDLDSKAIRLTNKLSYDTYAGYPTAMIPNFASAPAGTGLYIGWQSGTPTYGIDTTISNPYNNSQATIDSDLIPIGTYNMPRDFERVEYRLTKALVSGESVTIKYRLLFDKTDQSSPPINTFSTIFTDSTVGSYSNSQPVSFKNAQWLQMQVVLNSTVSSPSYVRLKEIRITGLQGQGPLQQIAL